MELTGGLGFIGAIVAKFFFAPRGFDVVKRVDPHDFAPVFTPVVTPTQAPALAPAPSAPAPVRRARAPHATASTRRIVTVEEAVNTLIAFMNAEGNTGYFAADEIDEWWKICAELEDLEPLDCSVVREALEARKLKVGRKRLNMPEYLSVKQRTGSDRLVLFRIPKSRLAAEFLPASSPASPGANPVSPGVGPAAPKGRPASTRTKSGRTPAQAPTHIEKPEDFREAA